MTRIQIIQTFISELLRSLLYQPYNTNTIQYIKNQIYNNFDFVENVIINQETSSDLFFSLDVTIMNENYDMVDINSTFSIEISNENSNDIDNFKYFK